MVLSLNIAYLLSAIGFITGIKLMANPLRSSSGNLVAAISMTIAIITTFVWYLASNFEYLNGIYIVALLLIGGVLGKSITQAFEITQMPELISLFNAFGGLCALIIGINEVYIQPFNQLFVVDRIILLLGIFLGGVSFTGSIIAFFKLKGELKKRINTKYLSIPTLLLLLVVSGIHIYSGQYIDLLTLSFSVGILALVLGLLISFPVGGADMPVLISVLNAVTGIATAFSGIVFESTIMLLGGILVGSTGVFLTVQMCKAMNRSLRSVLIGFNSKSITLGSENISQEVQEIHASEAATLLAFSKNVAIIPGFGMAVSQAQKECFELQTRLENNGVNVKYIIHPVAGRMPGHMNVLLAEANVDYVNILEMDEVNHKMNDFDVAIVIGANDVVNPVAEEDSESAIYGMPIIKVYNSKQVILLKRSMASGYSGVVNTLLSRPNCRVFFGDARKSLNEMIDELKLI